MKTHTHTHTLALHCSRGHFPILSRDPSFQKTTRTPGETAPFFFYKKLWLQRMDKESTPRIVDRARLNVVAMG